MIRTMSCLSTNSTNQATLLCHPRFIKHYATTFNQPPALTLSPSTEKLKKKVTPHHHGRSRRLTAGGMGLRERGRTQYIAPVADGCEVTNGPAATPLPRWSDLAYRGGVFSVKSRANVEQDCVLFPYVLDMLSGERDGGWKRDINVTGRGNSGVTNGQRYLL